MRASDAETPRRRSQGQQHKQELADSKRNVLQRSSPNVCHRPGTSSLCTALAAGRNVARSLPGDRCVQTPVKRRYPREIRVPPRQTHARREDVKATALGRVARTQGTPRLRGIPDGENIGGRFC